VQSYDGGVRALCASANAARQLRFSSLSGTFPRTVPVGSAFVSWSRINVTSQPAKTSKRKRERYRDKDEYRTSMIALAEVFSTMLVDRFR